MTTALDKRQAMEQFINACFAEEGMEPIKLESYEEDSSRPGSITYRITVEGGGPFELTITDQSKN